MSIFDRLRSLLGGASPNGGTSPDCGTATDGEGMISCHEALALVHDYLDGELEGVPQARVKAHFDVCQQCYPHLRLEGVFRDTLRRAAETQKAPEDLKARIAAMLSEADADE